jgi:RNA polymerase sigma factor (sigma-70 family)
MSAAALVAFLRRRYGSPAPDADLLRAYTDHRDGTAFRTLVERHGPLVRRLCRRLLGDTHDADDAFQATFLTLARRADALRRPEALTAWLHGVARRVCANARAARDRRRAAEARVPPRTVADPAAELTARELLDALDTELDQLPERFRLPLLLVYWQGLTHPEAARRLGLTPGALYGRLIRGRAKLAARLTRRGLAPSALLAAPVACAAVPADLLAATIGQAADPWAKSLPAAVLALAAGGGSVKLWAVVALGVVLAGAATWRAGSVSDRSEALPLVAHAPGAPADLQPAAPRVDRYGDPLPEGALFRLGTVRMRHGGEVKAVAFSPDGLTLASGGGDNLVRLWDVASGKQQGELDLSQQPPQSNHVHALAFSPDGRTIAVCGWGTQASLWDQATGKPLWRTGGVGDFIVFSPDGRTVASGGSHVTLQDAATGKAVARVFPTGASKTIRAAFSPNGQTIITGGNEGTLRCWDVTTRREVWQLRGHEGEIQGLAVSPDGHWVASSSNDKTVRLWNAATGMEVRRFDALSEYVLAVAFSPDGKTLAVSGSAPFIVLCDVATGKETGRLPLWTSVVSALTFSSDGRRLSAGTRRQTIHVWDLATKKELHQFGGHRSQVTGVAFTPDGKTLATASRDATVRLWDPATGIERRVLDGYQGLWVRSLAVAPDGAVLAAAFDQWQEAPSIRLWRTATGEELVRIPTRMNDGFHLAFSPDGRALASANGDGSIHLWDPATGRSLRQIRGHKPGPCYGVAFSPDGKTLVSGGLDKMIRLYDVATGEERRVLEGQRAWVMAVAFTPKGRCLVSVGGHDDPSMILWDVADGRELYRRAGGGLTLSPDGRTVASVGSDRTVRVWEVATGQERAQFRETSGYVSGLAFAPGGRVLVSGGADGTALLWDVTGGRRTSTRARPDELESWWTDLASGDAARAHRAMWSFAAAPEDAVPFFKDHLRPLTVDDKESQRITRLVTDLDSPRFATRAEAETELAHLADLAAPALRQALANNVSLEVRQRIERLLTMLDVPITNADLLRQLRAVEALEHSDTPAAREHLRTLAGGAAGARLTDAATAALRQLAKAP